MAYFQIGNTDFSAYVNRLNVTINNNYVAQTNAAGDTVVDYINSKRVIEVGIIPLSDTNMRTLLSAINNLNVTISYRNPSTGALSSNVNCILPSKNISYYTIQTNNVSYQALTLQFIEL